MQLMIATGNQGKLREIKKIIAGFPQLNLDILTQEVGHRGKAMRGVMQALGEFLQTQSLGTV